MSVVGAGQDSACVGLVDAARVLGQFAVHFGAEVYASHLGEASEVDQDVG